MREETTGSVAYSRNGAIRPATRRPVMFPGVMHRRESMRRARRPNISRLKPVPPTKARADFSANSAMIISSPHVTYSSRIRFTRIANPRTNFLHWRRVFLSYRSMPRPQSLDALDCMAAVIIRLLLPPAMTSRTNDPFAPIFSPVFPTTKAISELSLMNTVKRRPASCRISNCDYHRDAALASPNLGVNVTQTI